MEIDNKREVRQHFSFAATAVQVVVVTKVYF